MNNLFELTEAKKLSSWMIGIAVLLLIFFAVIHFLSFYDISFLDTGRDTLRIAGEWYQTQPVVVFGSLILGTILLSVGIGLHVLCNNVSRLMKSYDEEMFKKCLENKK